MTRRRTRLGIAPVCAAVLALAASLAVAAFPPAAAAQQPPEAARTAPSSETVRSLLMNDWADTVAIHYARQLYKADSKTFGPYLAGLHQAADWSTNQIDGASAFFRADVLAGSGESGDRRGVGQPTGPERAPTVCDTSGEVNGDDVPADSAAPHSFPSVMCFDAGGVLNVEYLGETARGLPIQIEKSYAMPPNRSLVVVRYTLANNLESADAVPVRVRLAEVVDLNNKAALDFEESADDLTGTGINVPDTSAPIHDLRVGWHPDLGAWIADMSEANGTFLVFGMLGQAARHRSFMPVSDQLPFEQAVAPEVNRLDQPDLPQDTDSLVGWDAGLSMWSEVTIHPGSRRHVDVYYAVTTSAAAAADVAREARQPGSRAAWFDQTRSAYRTWLAQGRQVETEDAGLREAYGRALITDKQSQQPEFGSFVAATNPAYGFKVWARDSSVTALGLAASGHLDEAVKYYRWMASVQEDGSDAKHPAGSWFTTYSYWVRRGPLTFVDPELDSLGLFIIGVYHTWRLLNDQDPAAARAFLTAGLDGAEQGPRSVYDAVGRAADYVASNIDDHDFGPADFSIWEEDLERAMFTQVTYASGLNAARLLAETMGETGRAGRWLAGAQRIRDAIDRPASDESCPGLWNDRERRWNRGTGPNCTPDARLDASTDLAWVFGLVDAGDERVGTQRAQVLARLTPGEDDLGITRYEGDNFYYDKPFSPGGMLEASAAMPSWPQMDMYVAIVEHWQGLDDVALERLQWYARVTNAGYMPPGEAVDWPTDRPLPSTASEPVTGTWFVMALLAFVDQFDPRLPPLEQPATRAP